MLAATGRRLAVTLVACAFATQVHAAPVGAPPQTLTLRVDATQAPRGMLHSVLEVPVKPGPVTPVIAPEPETAQ